MTGIVDQLDKWTTTHRLAERKELRQKLAERDAHRLTGEDVKERVEKRMAEIDGLSPEQRLVVHEHGWCLVKTFMAHGVTKPKSMRALINAVTSAVIDRKDRT